MMAARWWDRFRVARRTAVGLGTLGLFGVAVIASIVWRASSIVNRLLREWAGETVAEQSGGVYELRLGRVHLDWPLRRVAVDSISIATARGVNGRRIQPLPGLRLALTQCTISGVHFVRLALNRGLVASSFGCRQGTLAVEVPRRATLVGPVGPGRDPAAPAFGERPAFLVFQQGVRLPSYAPRIRMAQVLFPRMALDLRLPGRVGRSTRFQLERLQWTMSGLVIDPADTTAAARPLFSRSIELVATNFTTHPDSAMALRVGLLRSSLTDSTLEIRDVGFEPSTGGAGFRRSRKFRHDLLTLSAGWIRAKGIDFGAFVAGDGVRARLVEVDSLRLQVTSDKRLSPPPRGPRLTPQQWIAGLDETLRLDSLRVYEAEVVYREYAQDRGSSGLLAFTRMEVVAANVSHFVGRTTSEDPMTLVAKASIQGAGRLDVRMVIPLDAPRFDMSFHGTLGEMPAAAFNSFVVPTNALRIEKGQIVGASFAVAVRNGLATGVITPRFNGLSVSVTRDGSTGVMGGGGIVGGSLRRVASYASRFKLRADNPAAPNEAARAGAIRHRFTPEETLIGFLWSGLRDGLITVLKR